MKKYKEWENNEFCYMHSCPLTKGGICPRCEKEEEILDIDRLKKLRERFLEWAKDNDYDNSYEMFIESNLEALGY